MDVKAGSAAVDRPPFPVSADGSESKLNKVSSARQSGRIMDISVRGLFGKDKSDRTPSHLSE